VLGALQFAARTHYRVCAMDCSDVHDVRGVSDYFSQAGFLAVYTVLFVVGFAATSQMAATNRSFRARAG